ncbi:MAG: hypothetical protein R6V35_03930 [Candidatus Nanohaloarchaea archaeon]
MSDDRKLSIGNISELTTGSSGDFKEKVSEMELTLNDLRALKEAESSGKNRDEIIEFIDRQITEENVSAYLGLADNDVGELSDLINEIERVEDIEHFDEENIDIDQDKLIDLVGGTVNELKEFVNENPLTAEQLENVLNAEERVKNRKTAKSFLEKKIKKRQVGQDMEKAHEDLEKLKEDLDEVREDEGLGKEVENDDKEEESEEKDSEEDSESEESESEEENEEDSDNDEEDSEDDDNESDEENDEDESDEASEKEKEDDEVDQSEEENEDSEDPKSENESSKEKKKELAGDLDLDMSDEELENFSVKDLEKIRSEKEHREHLIEKLSDQGMEEEELRSSSTEDLEKIAESIDEKEESKEEHEEMREEAEEDLEMLMGAVRWDDEGSEEDQGKSTKEKIEDLKSNIRNKLSRDNGKSEDKNSGINADRVSEILDQYRELDDEEASIKTAHIMKGFLERTLELEREMTYKELAETMPTEEESMESLAEFFLKLHREQYTGKFDVDDPNEIIDICEEVIQKMS